MSQKYIRVKKLDGISNIILLFPKILDHSKYVRQLGLQKDEIVSAGFVHLDISDMGNPKYKCYGKSVSLNLPSKEEEDSKHLNYQIYETYNQDDF